MRTLLCMAVALCVGSPARAQVATVEIDRVRVQRGPGDAEIMHRALRRGRHMLRYCYEQHLLRVPGGEGRIDVVFTVPAEGAPVAEVARRSFARPDTPLEQCLLGALVRIRLAPAAPATYAIRLVLGVDPSPEPAPAPAVDMASVRAEISAARERARCLARAARELEALTARFERAGPRERERVSAAIGAARERLASCDGLLAILRAPTVELPLEGPR